MNTFDMEISTDTPGLITAEQIAALKERTSWILHKNKLPDLFPTKGISVTYTFSYFLYNPNDRALRKSSVSIDLSNISYYTCPTQTELLKLGTEYCPPVSKMDSYTQIIKLVTPYNLSPLELVRLMSRLPQKVH